MGIWERNKEMKAIVFLTHIDRKQWIENALKSLEGYTKYPIVVLVNGCSQINWNLGCKIVCTDNNFFEAGGLQTLLKYTDIDEFVYLHDSVEIKDTELFDKIFSTPNSVALSARLMMFMGKFKRDILNKMDIPMTKTPVESVLYEDRFGREYCRLDKDIEWLDPVSDTKIFDSKFGKNVMILENKYLKKYKSKWNMSMV